MLKVWKCTQTRTQKYKELKIICYLQSLTGTITRYATRRCTARPYRIKQFNPLNGKKSSLRYPEVRSQAEHVFQTGPLAYGKKSSPLYLLGEWSSRTVTIQAQAIKSRIPMKNIQKKLTRRISRSLGVMTLFTNNKFSARCHWHSIGAVNNLTRASRIMDWGLLRRLFTKCPSSLQRQRLWLVFRNHHHLSHKLINKKSIFTASSGYNKCLLSPFNDTATTEIYTSLFVGSVRCV